MKLSDRIKALSLRQRAMLRARLDRVILEKKAATNGLTRGVRLVAYVVSRKSSAGEGEFRQFLKAKLPDYMVPSAFVLVDSLPVTANGKVDRHALPRTDRPNPDTNSESNGAKPIARGTPAEEQLMEIWREILGVAKVEVNDNFFYLGGHSLLALRLLARLRKVFKIDLQLKTIFESPTVASLSEAIEQAQTDGAGVPIKRVPRLSAEQFQARLDSASGNSISLGASRSGETAVRK